MTMRLSSKQVLATSSSSMSYLTQSIIDLLLWSVEECRVPVWRELNLISVW